MRVDDPHPQRLSEEPRLAFALSAAHQSSTPVELNALERGGIAGITAALVGVVPWLVAYAFEHQLWRYADGGRLLAEQLTFLFGVGIVAGVGTGACAAVSRRSSEPGQVLLLLVLLSIPIGVIGGTLAALQFGGHSLPALGPTRLAAAFLGTAFLMSVTAARAERSSWRAALQHAKRPLPLVLLLLPVVMGVPARSLSIDQGPLTGGALGAILAVTAALLVGSSLAQALDVPAASPTHRPCRPRS